MMDMATGSTLIDNSLANGSSTSKTASSSSVVLSPRAYVKMLMHALRYPYATVNGVLIAQKKGSTSSSSSGGKAKSTSITFVDCVPLFHSGHGLTPMVEVALTQISAHLSKKSPDHVIGGYYQMNEIFHEFPHPMPPAFAERIAEKIWETNNEALLLMLSGYNLANSIDNLEQLEEIYYTFEYHSGEAKWKPSKSRGVVRINDEQAAFEAVHELIFGPKKIHLSLVDFDAHLEDIQLDWLNVKVNDAIEKVIART